MEEKECPKKGVLGRDIKSSSTGVIPPRSIPVRKGSLSLFFSFSFTRSISSLPMPPLSIPGSSSFRLPCLAKTRRLSLKVTRRNRRRVTRACKRIEGKRERERERGREFSGWWAAGTTKQTVHALFALWILPKIP